MTDLHNQHQCSILAVQEVPKEETQRYGIVKGVKYAERLLDVSDFVEKPKPEVAPSNLAVAGRYILTPAVFGHIREQPKGAGGGDTADGWNSSPPGQRKGLGIQLYWPTIRLRKQVRAFASYC